MLECFVAQMLQPFVGHANNFFEIIWSKSLQQQQQQKYFKYTIHVQNEYKKLIIKQWPATEQ